MTKINAAMLRDLESRARRGETYRQLAESYGLSVGTVYGRLWRAGFRAPAQKVAAVNAGRADRATRWVTYNGGCSTLSGPVPVTLPRVSCLEERAA